MCRHTKSLLTGVALLALVGAGAGAVSMIGAPSAPRYAAAAPVPAEEQAQTIAAMKPPKRARPVIALIGHNDGTETTDYIIPYSVLTHSGVADVVALAPEARPIKLVPALAVQPQATTAAFDARYPDGADYVVVAAMHPRDDPTVVAWIKRQAANGAVIVGVCSGVRTLSAAGLLAGRRATRYWWDAEDLAGSNPTTRWVSDRRYVVDRGVVTTTGITASLPISLALVEAIAGRDRAADVAREFGVASWDARHNSEAFGFDRGMILAGITNKAAFWNSETRGLPVRPGVDELALAFTADAWSRTFRSNVVTVGNDRGPVETRRGLTLLPDRTASGEASVSMLPYPRSHEPAEALPEALAGIASRYGVDTAEFVAVQLEYPWQPK